MPEAEREPFPLVDAAGDLTEPLQRLEVGEAGLLQQPHDRAVAAGQHLALE